MIWTIFVFDCCNSTFTFCTTKSSFYIAGVASYMQVTNVLAPVFWFLPILQRGTTLVPTFPIAVLLSPIAVLPSPVAVPPSPIVSRTLLAIPLLLDNEVLLVIVPREVCSSYT
jgi:hypothetical protein